MRLSRARRKARAKRASPKGSPGTPLNRIGETTEAIMVGLIEETIGEMINGVGIANGMEMHVTANVPLTAVGTTILGMFEVVYICLLSWCAFGLYWICILALRFSTSMRVSSASTILTRVIWYFVTLQDRGHLVLVCCGFLFVVAS